MGKFTKGHPKLGGIKKGQKHRATIDKEFHREVLRQMVVAALEPMAQAQIEHAQGVNYMILRMPDGTYARATDEKQIDTACAIGATAFRINTQAPNTQAFVALLDRALDKPKEQAQDLNVNVSVDVADVLKQRFLKRKQGKS